MIARTLHLRPYGSAAPVARALFWATTAALSALIVLNTLPYYRFSDAAPFFLEKAAAYRDPVWRVSFYVHVTGGMLCLLTALPQFSRRLLRAAPAVHRVLGWTYVSSVLALVVPAGLYMSIYAKGGMPGRFGFLLTGMVLLYTTWRGLERVRARDFRGHASWMVRSYAMAATAITFRIFFIGLHALGASDAYVGALWLSFFVNLAIGEWIVARKRKGPSR